MFMDVVIYSEGELEEVLTTYTKLNKSASIFLGSNAKSNYDARTNSASIHTSNSGSDTHLARRNPSNDDLTKGKHVLSIDASLHYFWDCEFECSFCKTFFKALKVLFSA